MPDVAVIGLAEESVSRVPAPKVTPPAATPPGFVRVSDAKVCAVPAARLRMPRPSMVTAEPEWMAPEALTLTCEPWS